jgi:hypothetical protein
VLEEDGHDEGTLFGVREPSALNVLVADLRVPAPDLAAKALRIE